MLSYKYTMKPFIQWVAGKTKIIVKVSELSPNKIFHGSCEILQNLIVKFPELEGPLSSDEEFYYSICARNHHIFCWL